LHTQNVKDVYTVDLIINYLAIGRAILILKVAGLNSFLFLNCGNGIENEIKCACIMLMKFDKNITLRLSTREPRLNGNGVRRTGRTQVSN
jgi:hypothetical protein